MRPVLVRNLHLFRVDTLLCLSIIITGLIHSDHVECTDESELWSKYRPLAMDESWKLVKSRPELGEDYTDSWTPESTVDSITNTDPYPIVSPDPSTIDIFPERSTSYKKYQNNDVLLDINQWDGKNVKDNLFKLPYRESAKLTKLINRETPTFIAEDIVEPSRSTRTRNDGGHEQVLASYKVLVPIFVPAIKRKVLTTKKPPVRFVKEQITEMVPVKNIVPHVKEVIKAEEVPQQLITDYVATNDNTVPSNVDPSLRSGERLLSSVVKNIN